jgi:hypothetical protein
LQQLSRLRGNLQANDLSGNVFSASLIVVHDTSRGGKDDVAELTGRKQLGDPLLELVQLDIVARGDAASLVDTAVELDHDLAGAVVVNLLELTNIS